MRFHYLFLFISCLQLFVCSPHGVAISHGSNLEKSLQTYKLLELEEELRQVETELDQVSRFNMHSGSGPISYRSRWHDTTNNPEFIEIDLGAVYPIDLIALVPNLWRDHVKGPQADSFPLEFRILAGTKDTATSTLMQNMMQMTRYFLG